MTQRVIFYEKRNSYKPRLPSWSYLVWQHLKCSLGLTGAVKYSLPIILGSWLKYILLLTNFLKVLPQLIWCITSWRYLFFPVVLSIWNILSELPSLYACLHLLKSWASMVAQTVENLPAWILRIIIQNSAQMSSSTWSLCSPSSER